MGGCGDGEVSFVLELEDEFGEEGCVLVEALAGGGAGGSRLAAFGEDATGEKGVGAAVVRDDAEAGGEGAIDADAEEVGAAGDEGAEVLEALGLVGGGVEVLPAEGVGGDCQETEPGGAAGFGVADVDAEGVLGGVVLVHGEYFRI